ncbi:serine hydrolase domain-containing protein [Tellurirhabdus rosea]|uniref:serine hydrolase domain-containing protein n=1 Tax=Tellurirhabdus rosea TaxID=2674997 RepID=UPI002258A247|nr:serine hydrolase domain-containing protein [Tellurirhabdus rosea]
MKSIFSLFLLLFFLTNCSVYRADLPSAKCNSSEIINAEYSRAAAAGAAIKELAKSGVPGAVLAVYSKEGWWTTSAGYAKIEDKTAMEPCHLQYLQSVAKTYMAVAVLKLYEQGKVDLDAPMTRYLPDRYSRYIADAQKITVRMLLNHTSGVPEYNSEPAYVTTLLQKPDYPFTPEDYLKYINGKPLTFEPGSRHSYRNTNFVLLALLTDALTGDHARFITQTIFEPLGLTQTFYRSQPGYLNYPNLVNAYWDRHSDGIVENASRLQRNNVAALIGDDGIVATPVDAVKFLKGLMEGKLLSAATMAQMKTWVNDPQGKPAYGLGLIPTTINGHEGWGHSGGGIGAGCELYYFPKEGVYVFIGVNLGTVTDSPLHVGLEKARDKVYEAVL